MVWNAHYITLPTNKNPYHSNLILLLILTQKDLIGLYFKTGTDKLRNVSSGIISHVYVHDHGSSAVFFANGLRCQLVALRRAEIIDTDLLRHGRLMKMV